MRKSCYFFLSLFLVAILSAACSTHRTETREVTYDQRTGEPVTVEKRTTTTTDSTTEDTGVLSGTPSAAWFALSSNGVGTASFFVRANMDWTLAGRVHVRRLLYHYLST